MFRGKWSKSRSKSVIFDLGKSVNSQLYTAISTGPTPSSLCANRKNYAFILFFVDGHVCDSLCVCVVKVIPSFSRDVQKNKTKNSQQILKSRGLQYVVFVACFYFFLSIFLFFCPFFGKISEKYSFVCTRKSTFRTFYQTHCLSYTKKPSRDTTSKTIRHLAEPLPL